MKGPNEHRKGLEASRVAVSISFVGAQAIKTVQSIKEGILYMRTIQLARLSLSFETPKADPE